MSATTSASSALGPVIAGLATSVVETVSPGLLTKIETVTSHDLATFTSHNPELAAFAEELLGFGESVAAEHGLGVVNDIFNGLAGIFAKAPSGVIVKAS